jgi:hypothetical protein
VYFNKRKFQAALKMAGMTIDELARRLAALEARP